MDDDTITFLRELCAKTKEVATLCDAYLERQAKKNLELQSLQALSKAEEQKFTGNRLIPLTKWPEFHSWPSVAGLRHMIFFSGTTGADYFIRRASRRILICEKSFFEWANMSEEQRIKSSPEATRLKEACSKKY